MVGGDNYDAELEAVLQAVRGVGADDVLLVVGDCTGALSKSEWAGRALEGRCTGMARGVALDLIGQECERVREVLYYHMHSHTGNIPQGYADAAAKCHAMGAVYSEGSGGCKDTSMALYERGEGKLMRKAVYGEVKGREHMHEASEGDVEAEGGSIHTVLAGLQLCG